MHGNGECVCTLSTAGAFKERAWPTGITQSAGTRDAYTPENPKVPHRRIAALGWHQIMHPLYTPTCVKPSEGDLVRGLLEEGALGPLGVVAGVVVAQHLRRHLLSQLRNWLPGRMRLHHRRAPAAAQRRLLLPLWLEATEGDVESCHPADLVRVDGLGSFGDLQTGRWSARALFRASGWQRTLLLLVPSACVHACLHPASASINLVRPTFLARRPHDQQRVVWQLNVHAYDV